MAQRNRRSITQLNGRSVHSHPGRGKAHDAEAGDLSKHLMHGEFANALPNSTRSLLLRRVSVLLLASFLFALIPQSIMGQTAETNGSGRANADIENGIQLFRNHDAAGAKLKFSAAVKENPHSADALTWRGIAENQLKEYSEAVRDFEAALHINADEMS